MVKLTVVPVIPLALSDATKTAHVSHLRERHNPPRVGRACEKLLELFIGYSRCLELGDFARSPRLIRATARPDLGWTGSIPGRTRGGEGRAGRAVP